MRASVFVRVRVAVSVAARISVRVLVPVRSRARAVRSATAAQRDEVHQAASKGADERQARNPPENVHRVGEALSP